MTKQGDAKWMPTNFLKISIGIQLISVAGWAAWPRLWRGWLVPLAAAHFSLIASGLFPRSSVLGSNLSRLSIRFEDDARVALTFDDGPDPDVTPEVLRILRERGAVATFFLVGAKAERNPELVKQIASDGHEVGNHSWSHSPGFYFAGLRQLRREIDSTQQLLETLTGTEPIYFRPPAGIRSPLAHVLLHRRQLQLVSWSRRGFDTTTRDPHTVLARLVKRVAPGDILLLHDGNSARTNTGEAVILRILPELLESLQARGLRPGRLTLVPEAPVS